LAENDPELLIAVKGVQIACLIARHRGRTGMLPV
jgi:hypothetical protein